MNRPCSVFLRVTAIAVSSTGALAGLAGWLAPGVDLDPNQPFATLLSQWCAVVLLGCAAWAWLVTMAVLAEAVRAAAAAGPSARLRPRRAAVPAAYRRLVLGACGVVLAAGSAAPALATPGPVHLAPHAAAATPASPPPVTAPTTHARPSHRSSDIVVHHGDSLWRLAAERLPEDASNATIAHTWRRLYAANHDLIGADPDHLEPGQRLTRPQVW